MRALGRCIPCQLLWGHWLLLCLLLSMVSTISNYTVQAIDLNCLRRRHCRIYNQQLLFLCLWLLVMVRLAHVELHCDCSLRSRSPPLRLFEREDRVDEDKRLRWEGCLGRLLAC